MDCTCSFAYCFKNYISPFGDVYIRPVDVFFLRWWWRWHILHLRSDILIILLNKYQIWCWIHGKISEIIQVWNFYGTLLKIKWCLEQLQWNTIFPERSSDPPRAQIPNCFWLTAKCKLALFERRTTASPGSLSNYFSDTLYSRS